MLKNNNNDDDEGRFVIAQCFISRPFDEKLEDIRILAVLRITLFRIIFNLTKFLDSLCQLSRLIEK